MGNVNLDIASISPTVSVITDGTLGSDHRTPQRIGDDYRWVYTDAGGAKYDCFKTGGTPRDRAIIRGQQGQNFAIQAGVNDAVKINGDTVNLTAGTRTAAQVAADITGGIPGVTAAAVEVVLGQALATVVEIYSDVEGDASSLDLQAVANDAYETLGIVAGTYDNFDGAKNDSDAYYLMAPSSDIYHAV